MAQQINKTKLKSFGKARNRTAFKRPNKKPWTEDHKKPNQGGKH